MKTRIRYSSQVEGLLFSRLPIFSSSEIEWIKGTADFFGINYYTATSVEDYSDDMAAASFDKDAGIRQVETIRRIDEMKIKA